MMSGEQAVNPASLPMLLVEEMTSIIMSDEEFLSNTNDNAQFYKVSA